MKCYTCKKEKKESELKKLSNGEYMCIDCLAKPIVKLTGNCG